jgi:quinolinate synthase
MPEMAEGFSTLPAHMTAPDSLPPHAMEEEILRLKKQHNAVILAHYYQEDVIQDLADFVGDSLDLSRKAAATDAEVIVFCGVKFMAETAKILNPQKQVWLPDLNAGCSLEDSCPADAFAKFRAEHPDHIALTYVNCSAEVKALSDIIVTSTNAEALIRQIPEDQPILFAPDKYLGGYLARKTGRDMTLWQGTCMVHEQFSEKELLKLAQQHPDAHIIAHPECPENLLSHADFIGSTSALIQYCSERPGESFIVLTEPGILHQMRKRSPGSHFMDVPGVGDGACVSCNMCPHMKLNTLEKLYLCMRDQSPALELSPALIEKAKKPLQRMLEMSRDIPISATQQMVQGAGG